MTETRRCVECGEPQRLVRKSVPYPQSGLSNVSLQNVPVWTCANGHEEVVVPNTKALHELLAYLIIRKPVSLVGPEVRFLRRRTGLSAKDFASRIGLTPVRLSELENGVRPLIKRTDVLIRLSIAAIMASRDRAPFPADLAPLVEQLENAWDVGEHRLRHNENASRDREWEEARG